jgi:hypothetical protein
MAEIRIGDCDIKLFKCLGINKYQIGIEQDFNDDIVIDCTIEQISNLGEALVAFASTNRG